MSMEDMRLSRLSPVLIQVKLHAVSICLMCLYEFLCISTVLVGKAVGWLLGGNC